jgi:hypothetical protein
MPGRTWKYLAVWAAATACAVLLSWLGVRDVLRAAVFDRPGLVQVDPVIHTSPSTPSVGTPTTRPAPVKTPHTTRPSPSADKIRSFSTRGGRAALTLSASAKLVSATPAQGYRTTVTTEPYWLRVDFTDGKHTSSIIASWYLHAPTVQIYEY